MAAGALACLLGKPAPPIRAILKQYLMVELDHPVVNEEIFRGANVNLIINACGEATLVICNSKEPHYKRQCVTVANCLWTSLIHWVNQTKDAESITFILENVRQMLSIQNVSC